MAIKEEERNELDKLHFASVCLIGEQLKVKEGRKRFGLDQSALFSLTHSLTFFFFFLFQSGNKEHGVEEGRNRQKQAEGNYLMANG